MIARKTEKGTPTPYRAIATMACSLIRVYSVDKQLTELSTLSSEIALSMTLPLSRLSVFVCTMVLQPKTSTAFLTRDG